jgi:hypothetical protein
MKRFVTFAFVILLLTGCVPALTPFLTAENDAVTVTLRPARAVYDVNVVILNVRSSDERCVQFTSDVVCGLGNLSARKTIVLTGVRNADERVSCVAYGFLSEMLTMDSYRPFACAVR